MKLVDWATTLSGFAAFAVVAFGSTSWIIKHYLAELKPNHGSSLRDAVDQLKEAVGDLHKDINCISVDLARLEGKVENHIEEHSR